MRRKRLAGVGGGVAQAAMQQAGVPQPCRCAVGPCVKCMHETVGVCGWGLCMCGKAAYVPRVVWWNGGRACTGGVHVVVESRRHKRQ